MIMITNFHTETKLKPQVSHDMISPAFAPHTTFD